MRAVLSILLSIGFVVISLAQESKILIDTLTVATETIRVGRLKSGYYNQEFEQGDRLLFSCSVLQQQKISSVLLFTPSGKQIIFKNPKNIKDEVLLVSESGNHTFQFQPAVAPTPATLKVKYVKLTIKKLFEVKLPPSKSTKPPKTLSLFDTVAVKNTFRQLEKSDTVIAPLFNGQTKVYPQKDIFSKTRNFIEIKVPEQFDVLVYWIGVGKEAKNEYDKLSQNPALKHYQTPLDAYAKGQQIQYTLPAFTEHTDLWLTQSKAQKDAFLAGKKINNPVLFEEALSNEFGEIKANLLKKDAPLYICFENKNEVTPLLVYFDMLSVQIKHKYKTVVKDTTIIKRADINVDIDLNDTQKATQQLQVTQEKLHATKAVFLKKIDQQHADLDSIKAVKLKTFEALQQQIDQKNAALKILKKAEATGQQTTPKEAIAITKLENTTTELKRAKEKIIRLEQRILEMEKTATSTTNQLKKPKIAKKNTIPGLDKLKQKGEKAINKEKKKVMGSLKNDVGKEKKKIEGKAKSKINKEKKKVRGKIKKKEKQVVDNVKKKGKAKLKKIKIPQ